MVRAIRATREVTTGGALPSLSMASTRASEARMSCSVGGAGSTKSGASRLSRPRTRSTHAAPPTTSASSGRPHCVGKPVRSSSPLALRASCAWTRSRYSFDFVTSFSSTPIVCDIESSALILNSSIESMVA